MIQILKAKEQSPAEFSGLSTDEKPVNVSTNSIFLELDTGDFYYFDGESWAKIGG